MVNFGIIGLGKIVHKFAHDIALVDSCTLKAVGSRNKEKAREFATSYNALYYYDSYEQVAANPEVDVIYIATPHTFHYKNTMMCLHAGKAVICEKPFAMNTSEVKDMIKTAKEKNLFLMEALWTRFIPGTLQVMELIDSGAIGRINSISSSFGFAATREPNSRLNRKDLGGGSLLDIGIYPIFISLLLLGLPKETYAVGQLNSNNVDQHCAMIMKFKNNATASLKSDFTSKIPIETIIYGSKGKITMEEPFHSTRKLVVEIEHQETQIINTVIDGNGYTHEIKEVVACLKNNKNESDLMTHQFSLDLIKTLDHVRSLIGLEY
ncbi:putative dehydrogenase [Nonlabens dokdonensis]|uniref:Dehydrogenase n=2 Tax=Nonlabens dokdonensis TaxID=328515 RepID=A0ABX5PYH7_9FLAO|nr:Gfo/Idh/MocA family oxidoreductase [Nonlabens dokdonensis]AGC77443.1 putative dehydrogenase [Nonlabens dokdonensis DSW-6]PZX40967.1 putative dehydrogenase [Nonlabens dokdonensis]